MVSVPHEHPVQKPMSPIPPPKSSSLRYILQESTGAAEKATAIQASHSDFPERLPQDDEDIASQCTDVVPPSVQESTLSSCSMHNEPPVSGHRYTSSTLSSIATDIQSSRHSTESASSIITTTTITQHTEVDILEDIEDDDDDSRSHSSTCDTSTYDDYESVAPHDALSPRGPRQSTVCHDDTQSSSSSTDETFSLDLTDTDEEEAHNEKDAQFSSHFKKQVEEIYQKFHLLPIYCKFYCKLFEEPAFDHNVNLFLREALESADALRKDGQTTPSFCDTKRHLDLMRKMFHISEQIDQFWDSVRQESHLEDCISQISGFFLKPHEALQGFYHLIPQLAEMSSLYTSSVVNMPVALGKKRKFHIMTSSNVGTGGSQMETANSFNNSTHLSSPPGATPKKQLLGALKHDLNALTTTFLGLIDSDPNLTEESMHLMKRVVTFQVLDFIQFIQRYANLGLCLEKLCVHSVPKRTKEQVRQWFEMQTEPPHVPPKNIFLNYEEYSLYFDDKQVAENPNDFLTRKLIMALQKQSKYSKMHQSISTSEQEMNTLNTQQLFATTRKVYEESKERESLNSKLLDEIIAKVEKCIGQDPLNPAYYDFLGVIHVTDLSLQRDKGVEYFMRAYELRNHSRFDFGLQSEIDIQRTFQERKNRILDMLQKQYDSTIMEIGKIRNGSNTKSTGTIGQRSRKLFSGIGRSKRSNSQVNEKRKSATPAMGGKKMDVHGDGGTVGERQTTRTRSVELRAERKQKLVEKQAQIYIQMQALLQSELKCDPEFSTTAAIVSSMQSRIRVLEEENYKLNKEVRRIAKT
mmetsp:Transcript_11622/g.43657  ORF Transcript_11622/g.43657 Transcript_11622/m.43657 type:complete len:806 (-) Transcript_11622:1726-4143(-)